MHTPAVLFAVVVVALVSLPRACEGQSQAVTLKEASSTPFTVRPGATLTFLYTPPVVGQPGQGWISEDGSSRWVRVDAHTQAQPVLLTVGMAPSGPFESASGIDVGIVQTFGSWTADPNCLTKNDTWSPFPAPETVLITVQLPASAPADVNGMLFAQSYTNQPPVPGGCCLTCMLDDDPNLSMNVKDSLFTVGFSQAILGIPRDDASLSPHSCSCDFIPYYADTTEPAVQYSIYHFYGDSCGSSFHPVQDESSLFDALDKMSTVDGVLTHGTLIGTLSGKDFKRLTAAEKPGQLVVYNVLATDVYQQSLHSASSDQAARYRSVYTPRAEYGCSISGTDPSLPSCSDLAGNSASIGLSVAVVLVGLFLAVTGHRYYFAELFLIALIVFAAISYVVLALLFSGWAYKLRVGLCGLGGIVGGVVMLGLWRCLHASSICMVFVGMSFGALVAAWAFATPLGAMSVWVPAINFGMAYACITVFVSVVLIFRPRWLSMIASSSFGMYGVLAGIDYFVGSSFSSVVLNVLDRAMDSNFAASYSGHYFSNSFNGCSNISKNMIMLAAWLASSAVCVFIQACVTAKMDLPSSRAPLCSSAELDDDSSEARPLLSLARPAVQYGSARPAPSPAYASLVRKWRTGGAEQAASASPPPSPPPPPSSPYAAARTARVGGAGEERWGGQAASHPLDEE